MLSSRHLTREYLLTLRITGTFLAIFLLLFALFIGIFVYTSSQRQEEMFHNRMETIRQAPLLIDDLILRVRTNTLPQSIVDTHGGDDHASTDGSTAPIRPRPRGFFNIIVAFSDGKIFVRGTLEGDVRAGTLLDTPLDTVTLRMLEDDHSVYVYHFKENDVDVFFYEDANLFGPLQNTILVDGLLVIVCATLILSIISLRFARLTIAPIEESIHRLTEYNRNISHELRTPISIIRSNLQLARIRNAEKYIESSMEEIKIMEQIISALLFISEQKSVDREAVEVAPMAHTLAASLSSLYESRRIAYEIMGDGIVIQANPELLRSLLKNLIENAHKYATEGTKISVRISSTAIEVENLGRTLSEEELTHIFDPFYKGKGNVSQGFGLGLSIVRRIVDLHGWRVRFTSIEGVNCVRVDIA